MKETEKSHHERQHALERLGISVQSSGIRVESNRHFLVNLNADPSLNELLVYYLKETVTKVGCASDQDIQLSGVAIQKEHCHLEVLDSGDNLILSPIEGARSCVNGLQVSTPTKLRHGDRLVWGNNHFFKVSCPRSSKSTHDPDPPNAHHLQHQNSVSDFDIARQEMVENVVDALDPVNGAVRALETQHEQDKQRALEQQKTMYELQLQRLRAQMSPSTPYAPYGFDINGGRQTPSAAIVTQKDDQERDEQFRKSLGELKEAIVRANALVLEANALSQELKKATEFKVTLQVPAERLSPNSRQKQFLNEPAVLVQRKGRPSQIWSCDKLDNKLVDMREMYNESYDSDESDHVSTSSSKASGPSTATDDPFFETQENHHLIGVANVFLTCLFHDITLDYQVPIISQQGEVAGRLHVEMTKVRGRLGEREGGEGSECGSSDPASDEDEDRDRDGTVTVRVAIKAAKGLPRALAHFVFCQYSFCTSTNEQVVVPQSSHDDGEQMFEHSRTFDIQISEEFVEFCAEGALSVEVWGHRGAILSQQPSWEPMSGSNRSLAERWSELRRRIQLWVEIQELTDSGEYAPVEMQAGSGTLKDCATGGVYQLRQGQQRRVKVSVRPEAGSGLLPLSVDSIGSIAMGCVQVRDSRVQRSLDSYQEEDLQSLREKWGEALNRRKDHLDAQIQQIMSKANKSETDQQREQALIDQWVQLTEERNAVKCPAPGSGIPGAPADWSPPLGMEQHAPVIFLDLQSELLQPKNFVLIVLIDLLQPTT